MICLSFAVRKKTGEQKNEQRGATNFKFQRDGEKIKSDKETCEKVGRNDCKVKGAGARGHVEGTRVERERL